MRFPIVWIVVLCASFTAYAEETDPPKSACSEKTHGTLWPPEANRDQAVTQRQFVAGELWMCEGNYDWDAYFPATLHWFKWKRLSVRWKPKAAVETGAERADLNAAGSEPRSEAAP
jgi:hypothetical protein